MKQHRYRITVEHLADAHGQPSTHAGPLQFETGNHDDILAIVERVKQRGDLDARSATAMAVGLKLFGEIMLENRSHPLFAAFRPHFADFMKHLKSGVPQAGA
ncbi:DUF3861 domain-containing protein [Bordetella avium]|uniref:Uncharacterized protein n=1 Tax=Bordetella avium (strain 197N) TaxID=360910 RepID=Q2L0P5_BORA1|nr:DUF3861 domain-containing protein [Bordetella avium]AZY49205.1 DUF3861 domain-containing protein [Bordetella avium]AZY52560.1 DUF3861 domain-containing protein [Bordetella avium]RIQ12352.1 DUF3861 family protein [Bordetella avium]RIQ19278.1 DUF3861 family protein [Bordetella avium]RIQ33446.1 DUF3861 family protein [Bordetella avium]